MSNLIKVLAALTMIIDHLGMLFFPDIEAFRIIGRLSLPLFAYCLTEGYQHTKNIKKYLYRITAFAVIAQIPFSIIFQTKLNILFAFAFSLLLLFLREKYNRWIYLFILPAALLNFEYGIYSILLVIIFYEFRDRKPIMIAAFTAITLVYSISQSSVTQLFAITSLLAIKYLKDKPVKINKYAFYVLYPAQWAVLVILRMLIPV